MTLSALLVCGDKAAAEVLVRVLEELDIRVESCPDFARASIRLAQDRFDVAIVDGPSNSDVIALLRDTRLSRLNEATLAVAVVSGQDSLREMFSMGVNFVLYKPIAYDRALSSLKAARTLMRKEKRKSGRAAVHTHAAVDYANSQSEKATLINLAEDGMAVLFGKRLPPTSKVYFQFRLPQQSSSVRLSGQVIWQDWNGRAGVQFVDVPKSSRRLLADFLTANLPREGEAQIPDVIVEVEELQLATVGVAEELQKEELQKKDTQKRVPEQRTQIKMKEAAAEKSTESPESAYSDAEPQAEKDNRRSEKRYACRLGAEVYRTGTSVPNRCCLTDLSAGGCYLEVALPFPQGASVEILVRTYDMKLRLRGTVQASHPGFGMGISFELKTKEERESVQKLTEFVVSSTETDN